MSLFIPYQTVIRELASNEKGIEIFSMPFLISIQSFVVCRDT